MVRLGSYIVQKENIRYGFDFLSKYFNDRHLQQFSEKRYNQIGCFWSFPNIFLNTINKRKTSGRFYKEKKGFSAYVIQLLSRNNFLYFIGDILVLMELWIKFMTRFWKHWLTSIMLISQYASTFLKTKISNLLGSAKV